MKTISLQQIKSPLFRKSMLVIIMAFCWMTSAQAESMATLAPNTTAAGLAAYFNSNIYAVYGAYDYSDPNASNSLNGQLISGRLNASASGNTVTITGSHFANSNQFFYYWYQEPRNETRYPTFSFTADPDVVVSWEAFSRCYISCSGTFTMTSGWLDAVNASRLTVNGGAITQNNFLSGTIAEIINSGTVTINAGSVTSNIGGSLLAGDLTIHAGTVNVGNIISSGFVIIDGGNITLQKNGTGRYDYAFRAANTEIKRGNINFTGTASKIYVSMAPADQPGILKVTGGTITGLTGVNVGGRCKAAVLAGILPQGVTWTMEKYNSTEEGRAVEVSTLEIPASWHGTSNGFTPLDGKAAPTWDLSGDTPKIKFATGNTMEWGTKQTNQPQTLTTTVPGLTLNGNFSQGATATATIETVGNVSCPEFAIAETAGKLISLYNISVTGSYQGAVTVTIPVDAQHNGKQVSILHCNNGTLETMNTTVADGKVSGAFTSLSPFGVVLSGAPTGIDKTQAQPSLLVHPNPATDYIVIDNLSSGSVITVSDISGRMVYRTVATGKNEAIPVSSWANGIYLVMVQTDGNKTVGKVIKK